MKKPADIGIFPDAEAAASALADFGKSFILPCSDLTAGEIARVAGEGAWMRPLARKYAGAMELYRRWAEESVPRMIKSARYVINQGQYDLLVHRMGTDLLRTWRDRFADMRVRLSFGAAFRAVDLLSMAINEAEACRSSSIDSFLHVPLEGSTLKPLKLCIDQLLDKDFSVEIPASISVGYVATEEQYVLFQEAISALAARAGVSPIVYAYFCGEA
jgi:hypothetical protein